MNLASMPPRWMRRFKASSVGNEPAEARVTPHNPFKCLPALGLVPRQHDRIVKSGDSAEAGMLLGTAKWWVATMQASTKICSVWWK